MRRWVVILSIMTAVATASAQAVDPLLPQGPKTIKFVCPAISDYVDDYRKLPDQDVGEPLEVNEKTDMIFESLGTKGEEVEGPKKIVVRYINRLRFSFTPSIDVTLLQNPSLPQAFLVPDGMKPAANYDALYLNSTPPTPVPGARGGFGETFALIQICSDTFERHRLEVSTEAKNVNDAIEKARSTYQGILTSYPAVLPYDDAISLRNRAKGANDLLSAAIKKPYPSDHARVALAALNGYLQYLTALEGSEEYKKWKAEDSNNESRYFSEKQRPQSVKDLLAKFSPGSDEEKAARTEQERIAFWLPLFKTFSQYIIREAVNDKDGKPIPDVFKGHLSLVVSTDCHTIFGKGKQSKINYTITDLYGNSNQVISGVVTSVCPPLLTVSAGVGFSTLGTHTPGFIPTSTTTTTGGNSVTTVKNQIGYTEKSAIKPVYVVQMNAHIASLGKSWSAHGALGAAAVSRENTTNLEWLFGLSLAYKRAFFMTPAFHLGRQTSIGGGFSKGQTKPESGLDAVPTITNWKPGFAFTITYPLNK